MALSEFYESTIESVQVHFGFDNFQDSPDEITKVLGLEPAEVRKKGQIHITGSGKEIENKQNLWAISSSSKSKDVNVHLRELISLLKGKSSLIKSEWNAGFSVVWKGNYLYAGSGPFYESDVIQGIAELKAELWQDIYQIDEK